MKTKTIKKTNLTSKKDWNVDIELLDGGKLPIKAHDTDACYDCYVRDVKETGTHLVYSLGFKMRLPKDTQAKVYPRSGIYKQNLILSNSVGVIDEEYVGEWKATFVKPHIPRLDKLLIKLGLKKLPYTKYKIGERAVQFEIVESTSINFNITTIDKQTQRGDNGHCSTGLK